MTDLSSLGLSLSIFSQAMHIHSEEPFRTLSSAVVGSSFCRVRHVLNMYVDKNYQCSDPAADLRAFARQSGIIEPFVGLMTAVHLHKARTALMEQDGLIVAAVVTAGLSNATCAGVTPPFSSTPGTINIMVFLNGCLSRAGMVNAVLTVTEAKCAVLSELEVRTPQGHPATGTSTDTVTIACTGKGALYEYAGPVTLPGWLLARAVRQALTDALTQIA